MRDKAEDAIRFRFVQVLGDHDESSHGAVDLLGNWWKVEKTLLRCSAIKQSRINKLQGYIVQNREHSQYFLITITLKNHESLCCKPETYCMSTIPK